MDVIDNMMRSLGVLAVFVAAVGSFGCNLHQQRAAATPQATQATATEEEAFGASPRYRTETAATPPTDPSDADAQQDAPDAEPETKSTRGAYGYIADDAGNALVVEHEYTEQNAAPGTACYEAAKKMGLKSEATCTLINERQFIIVNDNGAKK